MALPRGWSVSTGYLVVALIPRPVPASATQNLLRCQAKGRNSARWSLPKITMVAAEDMDRRAHQHDRVLSGLIRLDGGEPLQWSVVGAEVAITLSSRLPGRVNRSRSLKHFPPRWSPAFASRSARGFPAWSLARESLSGYASRCSRSGTPSKRHAVAPPARAQPSAA
jgi:hypothetical protein